jgi:hypothetical protein
MKMGTFLITFKPASENPEHGWPLEKLQSLVRRQQSGDTVEEKWRFHNRKDVALGDRAFLLLQGKGGPAIIGYGQVNGQPEKGAGQWVVPIKFESLVDPSIEVLASKSEVRSIEGGQRYWRTQSSGVQLPEDVAANLESLLEKRQSHGKRKLLRTRTGHEMSLSLPSVSISSTAPIPRARTLRR